LKMSRMMDDEAFQAGWAGVIDEAKKFEALVAEKMAAMRLVHDESQEHARGVLDWNGRDWGSISDKDGSA
jgi:hypothetical protein